MQGNNNIDTLMMPVLDAIKRHVKDKNAITDIYNRAYEAVINSMDVNVDTHLNDKVSMTAELAALREQVRWRKLGQASKYGQECSGQDVPSGNGLIDAKDAIRAYVKTLLAENASLTAENERLSQLLHDEKSQLEIATDLGNKRWIALNQIYENGEEHNANWCKRKAQEGLGLKNA